MGERKSVGQLFVKEGQNYNNLLLWYSSTARVQKTGKSPSLMKFGYTQDNALLLGPIVVLFLSICDCHGFYT